ncbi:rhodanese-related sulfurtransferase [uncultured Pseudoteredinibacter sp.]|uniref:oxygen-dependent tRNA uridine(34) hydroxylase TrhO n=1 Tax=uncultured Pseudoteredinibacter sp. TaxID=1641701 RepID=UPI00260FE601|nr:rhodanese-related sulfurtransferase [uncultured Pseudoteredinibacter sp.]
MSLQEERYVVMALYKFTPFADFADWREGIQSAMADHQVKGSLLIAAEGINGTVAAERDGIEAIKSYLNSIGALAGFSYKESFCKEQPFNRSKVKLKKEIVTMGVPEIDPLKVVGSYVKPEDWNALISDPDVVLVDTRNDYEVELGTFKGALDPNTTSFREFPDYVAKTLDPSKHKKVAMFCTGGIRCEKSTAYMKEQGFDEVYHLEGGILKYLEEVDEKDSLWEGECFVFDGRVTVDHQLQPGHYELCHGCRHPIDEAARSSEKFEEGVSCPKCFDTLSEEQRQRFRMRQQQIQRAKALGQDHVGGDVHSLQEQNRTRKQALKAAQRAASLAAQRK